MEVKTRRPKEDGPGRGGSETDRKSSPTAVPILRTAVGISRSGRPSPDWGGGDKALGRRRLRRLVGGSGAGHLHGDRRLEAEGSRAEEVAARLGGGLRGPFGHVDHGGEEGEEGEDQQG